MWLIGLIAWSGAAGLVDAVLVWAVGQFEPIALWQAAVTALIAGGIAGRAYARRRAPGSEKDE